MKLNDYTRAVLKHLIRLPLPETVEVNFGYDGKTVMIQAQTQAAVREARVAFPGVIWTKHYNDTCEWWEYRGVVKHKPGFFADPIEFPVMIYSCKEAPATCTPIEEEVEVEEEVPTGWEKRTVVKKRVRWNCSDGAEVAK